MLSHALGGESSTISGLSGVGDLILTAFGDKSRNRRFGVNLAQGQSQSRVRWRRSKQIQCNCDRRNKDKNYRYSQYSRTIKPSSTPRLDQKSNKQTQFILCRSPLDRRSQTGQSKAELEQYLTVSSFQTMYLFCTRAYVKTCFHKQFYDNIAEREASQLCDLSSHIASV